jgi:hypothetical protein
VSDSPEPPAWWTTLQADFGAWLRSPLGSDPAPPSLVAAIAGEPPASREARLGLYRDQGQARLLGVLRATFPRLLRVLGADRMDALSHAFLQRRARIPDDLADLGAGLHRALHDALARGEGPLAAALDGAPQPAALLREAASLDEAERLALRAPAPRPSHGAPSSLAAARLALGPGCSLLRLTWSGLLEPGSFAPLATPRYALVARTGDGVAVTELDPVASRLIAQAVRSSLGEARAAILGACPSHLRERLAVTLDTIASQALVAGWWTIPGA